MCVIAQIGILQAAGEIIEQPPHILERVLDYPKLCQPRVMIAAFVSHGRWSAGDQARGAGALIR